MWHSVHYDTMPPATCYSEGLQRAMGLKSHMTIMYACIGAKHVRDSTPQGFLLLSTPPWAGHPHSIQTMDGGWKVYINYIKLFVEFNIDTLHVLGMRSSDLTWDIVVLGEVGHCCAWHVWVHSSLTDCLYNNIKLVFPQGHQFWAVFGIPTETLVFLCLVLSQFDPMFFNKDWIKKSPNCEIICWDTSYHKLGGYTLMWNNWIIISYAMEQSWLWSENLNQSDKPLHSMRNTDPILLH